MNPISRPPALLLAISLCCSNARADFLDDVGYRSLSAELGAAMPDGAGVSVSHVEAPNPGHDGYMPEAGSGTFTGALPQFAGKTITAKSGATAIASQHATEVGSQFYGNHLPWARMSLAPGTSTIDCWRAIAQSGGSTASWLTDLLQHGGTAPPAVQSRAVENHSWILDTGSSSANSLNDICRRLDYVINRDRVLCVCGVNNGSGSTTPALLASAFNNLSVGLSDGNHSRGGTPAVLDGSGRLKPEIVAPLDFTSFSTAIVSSAGVLLRQKASSTNSRAPQTLKAVLLAGATREEFPGWSKTATQPIDAVFGAGELNIDNSWHILNGAEQTPNLSSFRPARAWDYVTLTPNGTADYRITVPGGTYAAEVSAFAVWHSGITDTNASPGIFAPSRDALIDFNLTLFRDPVAGGPETVDASASTIYNLEHVRARNLPAGNYRLRLSRGAAAGSGADAAIAWRFQIVAVQGDLAVEMTGGNLNFSMTNLAAGASYVLETSADLQTWTDLDAFTPAQAARTFSTPQPADARRFYRLSSGPP